MFKALTPIFALIIAIGLGVTFVKPTFEEIRALQVEEADYVEAIATANDLRASLEEKKRIRDSYNPTDLERLHTMLPQETHEVALVLDLDALARRHRMSLAGIQVGAEGAQSAQRAQSPESAAPTDATDTPYTALDISFSLLGTYEDLRAFLESLEQSLVFFDVVDLTFGATEGDLTAYELTVRTYAYKPAP